MRAAVAVTALLLAPLVGCGGDDGPSAADAEQALEAQRADVREAAAGLGEAVVAEVEGRVVDSGGRYEGCESAFNEEFATFRYAATVRIAGGAGADLGTLVDEFTGEGVGVSLRPVPGGGAAGDWLVQAAGEECVDVPEGERDQWLARDEDEELLP